MADKSKIEWTDATWNPTTGCSKVSAGCKHCYAERVFPRVYGSAREFTDVQTHPDRLRHPLRWKTPRRIFVNSMSDLGHPDIPDDFLDQVFAVMALTPRHTYQVLTKRPQRMREYLGGLEAWSPRVLGIRQATAAFLHFAEDKTSPIRFPLANVWLGVSVENQATANERIPYLLQTPAARRFISYEPALGPVDFRRLELEPGLTLDGLHGVHTRTVTGPEKEIVGALRAGTLRMGPLPLKLDGIDWLIAGGESGPRARPAHPAWFRSARDQCAAAFVPFFFKQWGEWEIASDANGHYGSCMPEGDARYTWVNPYHGNTANPSATSREDYAMARVGKKLAGRKLDGRTHDELPKP